MKALWHQMVIVQLQAKGHGVSCRLRLRRLFPARISASIGYWPSPETVSQGRDTAPLSGPRRRCARVQAAPRALISPPVAMLRTPRDSGSGMHARAAPLRTTARDGLVRRRDALRTPCRLLPWTGHRHDDVAGSNGVRCAAAEGAGPEVLPVGDTGAAAGGANHEQALRAA